MKKKLQVFISSTYKDLQDERQAAVEAILGSNNIPAGMELFKAGNNSQWETIKKWINDSDVYMLILGGRYGSIEPASQKSYTHLEYEYAIAQNIPVFATVLSDDFLNKKAQSSPDPNDILEHDNKYMYNQFKELVMSKMVKMVNDCKDIKLAIYESISDLKEEYDFEGWTRGINNSSYNSLLDQNSNLIQEINNLREQLQQNSLSKNSINNDTEFWSKEICLNISGMTNFMEHPYRSQLHIPMTDIFKTIGPLIMVPTKIRKAKEDFEQNIKEKYASQKYSLSLTDNEFQNIKVQLFSQQLVELTNDSNNCELISLSAQGTSILCNL